jgi:hypothetical protein
MCATPAKSRKFSVVIAAAVTFQSSAVSARHASDHPVTAIDDAYGLRLGLESVGLYNPGLVRGFNPQAAGNVRIDGLYFDRQGALSHRDTRPAFSNGQHHGRSLLTSPPISNDMELLFCIHRARHQARAFPSQT